MHKMTYTWKKKKKKKEKQQETRKKKHSIAAQAIEDYI